MACSTSTQPATHSAERRQAAVDRFARFFGELRETFLEREDVLSQMALALLAREHVLVTGPPGTGKSALASAVVGRVVDAETGEPSLFAKQFTESTVHTELIGPVNFRTLTGRLRALGDGLRERLDAARRREIDERWNELTGS